MSIHYLNAGFFMVLFAVGAISLVLGMMFVLCCIWFGFYRCF